MSSDTSSLLLEILKFAGICLSGIFGLLGLLTEYRHKRTGKVTTWGRLALVGIVASTIVAAVAQALEISISKTASERELHEITRAVLPLDSMSIALAARIDLSDPALRPYRDRVTPMIDQFLTKSPTFDFKGKHFGAISVMTEIDGAIMSLQISPDSPAYPNSLDTAFRYLIAHLGFQVAFRKDPFSSSEVAEGAAAGFWDMDLAFNVIPASCSVTYIVKTKQFGLLCSPKRVSSDDWDKNNYRIVSTVDLPGSQIVFLFTGNDYSSGDDATVKLLQRLSRELRLEALMLRLPRARELVFDSAGWQQFSVNGEHGYARTLPDELSLLQYHGPLIAVSRPHERVSESSSR